MSVTGPHNTGAPEPAVKPIKVSRKMVPASMTYEEYVLAYRELLTWIKTIVVDDISHPTYAVERAFLGDHERLQK